MYIKYEIVSTLDIEHCVIDNAATGIEALHKFALVMNPFELFIEWDSYGVELDKIYFDANACIEVDGELVPASDGIQSPAATLIIERIADDDGEYNDVTLHYTTQPVDYQQ